MTTFFTDRDLGKAFPESLARARIHVVPHRILFADDCPDETWLAAVGSLGYIAVTHDRRIRYRPNQLEAVMRNGVRLLVVIGKAPHTRLADGFVRTLPAVLRFIENRPAPWIAKVYPRSDLASSGTVELWHPLPDRPIPNRPSRS